MYIYHVLINALSAHMIHINLNMIFYTHVEHSPTKTIYINYKKYKKICVWVYVCVCVCVCVYHMCVCVCITCVCMHVCVVCIYVCGVSE